MSVWREQVENDFVKNINDTYTLNLAISILEDREDFRKEIERLNNIINKIDEYVNKLRYYADEDDEGYKISKDIHNILQELKGEDKE